MTNTVDNFVPHDIFKMKVTKQFYFDLSGKKFCQKILKLKNCQQKLRHQVMEAEAAEAEAIQILSPPHPWVQRN